MEETEITTTTRNPLSTLIDFLKLRSPTSPHYIRLKSLLSSFPIVPRFTINIDELRRYDNVLTKSILSNPAEFIGNFEEEFHEIISSTSDLNSLYSSLAKPVMNDASLKLTDSLVYKKMVKKQPLKFSIGFTGNLGANEVTPSTIRSAHLMQLIKVTGIVTRTTPIFPKVRKIFHYCSATGVSFTKLYRDASDLGKVPTNTGLSSRDEEGNPLTTEFGLSAFEDTQYIQIQDLPEDNTRNSLGGTMGVLLTADLVDKCKAGDRVIIYGVIRASGGKANSVYRSITKTCIIANNISVYSSSTFAFKSPTASNEYLANINSHIELQQMFENFFNEEVDDDFFTSLNIKNKEELNFYLNFFKQNTDYAVDEEQTVTANRSTNRSREAKRNTLKMGTDELLETLANDAFPHIKGYESVKKAVLLQLLGGNELKGTTKIRGDIHIMLLGDPSTAKSQVLRSILNFASCAISASGRGSSGVGLTAVVKTIKTGGIENNKTIEAGAMVRADRGIICIDEFDKMTDYDRVALHEVMEQQTVTIAKAGIHCVLNARCSVLAAANPLYSTYDTSKSTQENINLPDSLLSRFDLIFVILDEHDNEKDLEIAKHVISNRIPGELKQRNIQNKFGFKQINNIIKICKYISKPKLNAESSDIIKECYNVLRNNESANFVLPITPRVLEGVIRLSTAVAKLKLKNYVEKEDCVEAIKILEHSLNLEIIDKMNVEVKRRKVVPRTRGRNQTQVREEEESHTVEEKYEMLKETFGVISENTTFINYNTFEKGMIEKHRWLKKEDVDKLLDMLIDEDIVVVTEIGNNKHIYRV
eukprot:GAHX01001213.1.p1 GENE.GAHX01001213.1~~GAHX01001213.1.p1  ORF type:complete len:815 (-),score=185.95 GAHX01001213.1:35-2479(-)